MVEANGSICASAICVSVDKGRRRILHDINVQWQPGKVHLIMGPNGAGKTTLLRALAGVVRLDSGTVEIDGQDLARLSRDKRARMIAWVPRPQPLPFSFTCLQVVLLGRFPFHRGHPVERDRHRATSALTRLGVEHLAHEPIDRLSSGEREKVMIARALALEPSLLILDEPTSHLDVGATYRTLTLLRDLAASGTTVIASAHDVFLARPLAHSVTLLQNGSLYGVGTPDEMLNRRRLKDLFAVDPSALDAPWATVASPPREHP